ncbi:MAG: hypothetical protein ACRDYB_16385, partial [Acidimicrobiales bacterium]
MTQADILWLTFSVPPGQVFGLEHLEAESPAGPTTRGCPVSKPGSVPTRAALVLAAWPRSWTT